MPELVCAADDPRWQDERRRGVTATDIVTILGLSSYDSPYSLYWRKRGDLPETADTDRWALGRVLEPYIITRWANTGSNWQDFVRWPGGLYRHSDRAWQMATPDRILGPFNDLAPEISLPVGVLECKSWADADRHAWGDGILHDDDGTVLVTDDQVPPAVRAQVLWQMDVMDVAAGHVGVVFLPSGEFRHYTIEHADTPVWGPDGHGGCKEQCMSCSDQFMMRAAGLEFWRRVAGELSPPDVDGSAATLAAVRARFPAPVRGKAVPVDGTLWAAWSDTKDLVKQYEGQMRAREAEIREQLGEGTEIEVGGQVVARRIIVDQPVKAHVRHMDYIRKLKNGNDD